MSAAAASARSTNSDALNDSLGATTHRLISGLAEIAADHHIALQTECLGGMFGILFCDEGPVRSFTQVANANIERFRMFFHGMLARNIFLAPSVFEAGFVSSAHGDAEIDATLAAADEVLGSLAP